MSVGISMGLGFGGSWSSGGLGALGGFGGSTLGEYIREAQLGDFLYSFGGPEPSPQPVFITTSAELPGSTHWDPAPVPVGEPGGGGGGGGFGGVYTEGGGLPGVDLLPWIGYEDTDYTPVEYSPPPIILPGQTDPGREEHEEEEVAHTWTHVGSQLLGALFPSTAMEQSFVAGPGQVPVGGLGPGSGGVPGSGVYSSGLTPVAGGVMGSCAPPKTRTLTIDCATGLEVKRKRRRRRALLTQGDMGVLFQIASLPNNSNVRVALAGAIRR